MNGWVLGILFNEDLRQTLLIKKKRGPKFNIGKWNSLGGHLEDKENPLQAIRREIYEESNLVVENWAKVCLLQTEGGPLYIFCAWCDYLKTFKQKEDEEVKIHKTIKIVENFGNTYAANLNWIVPMSINVLLERDTAANFIIKECY